MLNTAKRYLSSGLSVLPARKDTKRPAIGAWSLYQERLPFPSELERFNMNLYDGICLVCGKFDKTFLFKEKLNLPVYLF